MANEKYNGPDAYAAATGQSNVDSAWGTLAGGAGGAAIGAIAAHTAEKQSLKFVKKLPLGDMIKTKNGLIIGGALAGAVTVGTVASITGYFSGMHKAQNAADDFYRMRAERDAALAQLQAVESVAGGRFTDRIGPRAQAGSFAEAVQAGQQSGEPQR